MSEKPSSSIWQEPAYLKSRRPWKAKEFQPRAVGRLGPKTIDSILSNQKYAGASLARTSCISPETDSGFIHEDTKGNKYVLMGIVDDHPPIIPPETFDRVQQMRMDRSNIEYDQDGKKRRKNTHYSSKRGQVQEESES